MKSLTKIFEFIFNPFDIHPASTSVSREYLYEITMNNFNERAFSDKSSDNVKKMTTHYARLFAKLYDMSSESDRKTIMHDYGNKIAIDAAYHFQNPEIGSIVWKAIEEELDDLQEQQKQRDIENQKKLSPQQRFIFLIADEYPPFNI